MVKTTISYILFVLICFNPLGIFSSIYGQHTDFDPTIKSPDSATRTLIWSDEFGGFGPVDSTKWFHQTKLPSSGSWYNGEIQHYTNRTDNAVVANGKLIITARKERFTDQGQTKPYTSARLNSKFAFTYGYVEIRAKLPFGIGTWPALWLLGKNINENGAYWQTQGFGNTSWPACGEIDIMEHWGSNQNFVQSAMHTPSSHGATINHGGQIVSDVSGSFHIYSMEWNSEQIVFSVDGQPHYIYNPSVKNETTWPFDQEQYFVFNVAILPSIQNGFTSSAMEVDYIRVYQDIPNSVEEAPQLLAISQFPNPVRDELNFRLDQLVNEHIYMEIFNVTGTKIQSNMLQVNGKLFTLQGLHSLTHGIYYIKFQLDGVPYVKSFVKF